MIQDMLQHHRSAADLQGDCKQSRHIAEQRSSCRASDERSRKTKLMEIDGQLMELGWSLDGQLMDNWMELGWKSMEKWWTIDGEDQGGSTARRSEKLANLTGVHLCPSGPSSFLWFSLHTSLPAQKACYVRTANFEISQSRCVDIHSRLSSNSISEDSETAQLQIRASFSFGLIRCGLKKAIRFCRVFHQPKTSHRSMRCALLALLVVTCVAQGDQRARLWEQWLRPDFYLCWTPIASHSMGNVNTGMGQNPLWKFMKTIISTEFSWSKEV